MLREEYINRQKKKSAILMKSNIIMAELSPGVNYSATSNRASKWHKPLFFFPVFPDCQECFRISQLPMRRDAFCCRYSAWSCVLHAVISGYPRWPSGCYYSYFQHVQ